MSKKSSKKKKAVEVVPVSVRPLRDLTKRAVVDGLSGALGIDDITVREAVDSARGDLVAFKVTTPRACLAGQKLSAAASR